MTSPPSISDDEQARRQVKHTLAQAHDVNHDASPCWDHCLVCAPAYGDLVPTRDGREVPRPPDVTGGVPPPGRDPQPGDGRSPR